MKFKLASLTPFYYTLRNGMFCVLLTDNIKHTGLTDRDPITYPLVGVAVTPDGSDFEVVRWTADGTYNADNTPHDYDVIGEADTPVSDKVKGTMANGIIAAAGTLARITQRVEQGKQLSRQAAKTAYIN